MERKNELTSLDLLNASRFQQQAAFYSACVIRFRKQFIKDESFSSFNKWRWAARKARTYSRLARNIMRIKTDE